MNKQDIVLRGKHTKPLAQLLAKVEPINRRDSVLIYKSRVHNSRYDSVSYYHTKSYNLLEAIHVEPSKEEVDKLLAMANMMDRNDFLNYVYDLYN